MNIDIIYRGPLSSCDYSCSYCPFAKTYDDKAAREKDKNALERFVAWIKGRENKDQIRVLFTPWGEALIRKWYRNAVIELSQLPHIQKVVVQTNLSVPVDWLKAANSETVALWTTFHPTQIELSSFVQQSRALEQLGIKHSVGIVGNKENIDYAQQLRADLSDDIYLWVNAYKDETDYYNQLEIEGFAKVDPLFKLNLKDYQSLNKPCYAGENIISVNGSGDVMRCHFIKEKLGNLYEDEIHDLLKPRNCLNQKCDCYIGYMNLKAFDARQYYGDRILERIPITD